MKKTPFEKAGYKPDDVFVVMDNTNHPYIYVGEIVMLDSDDGSVMPRFKSGNNNYISILFWRLRKIGTL